MKTLTFSAKGRNLTVEITQSDGPIGPDYEPTPQDPADFLHGTPTRRAYREKPLIPHTSRYPDDVDVPLDAIASALGAKNIHVKA